MLDELLRSNERYRLLTLLSGNFLTLKQGDYTIYSEGGSADDGVLSNIFIFEKTRIKDEIAFWAERGEILLTRKLRPDSFGYKKASDIKGNPGQADYQVIEFESYDRKSHLGRRKRGFDVAGKDFFKLGDSPEEAGISLESRASHFFRFVWLSCVRIV
ncbi:MAG: hypothetical protein Ct9H90mP27_5950 [Gammaproteobacteria bacterium]|nr:MAG: hypothetical protein Ct9H90mP27_5950 [Gammaproteobacteria bacterium]